MSVVMIPLPTSRKPQLAVQRSRKTNAVINKQSRGRKRAYGACKTVARRKKRVRREMPMVSGKNWDTLDNFDKVERYYSSRFIKKYVDLLKEFIDTFFEKDCLEDLRSAIQMVLTSRQVYRALISHHLKDNQSFDHAQVPRKCRSAIRLLIKHGILKEKRLFDRSYKDSSESTYYWWDPSFAFQSIKKALSEQDKIQSEARNSVFCCPKCTCPYKDADIAKLCLESKDRIPRCYACNTEISCTRVKTIELSKLSHMIDEIERTQRKPPSVHDPVFWTRYIDACKRLPPDEIQADGSKIVHSISIATNKPFTIKFDSWTLGRGLEEKSERPERTCTAPVPCKFAIEFETIDDWDDDDFEWALL